MQPARLSVVDDMFYRGHHGRGVEVLMQGIWRFDDRLDTADLESFHSLLAASSLTRRVISPRFPWARRYFAGDAVISPVCEHPGVLESAAVVSWADRQGWGHIDVDNGPSWEVGLAHVDDGTSVVTVTCSHLVSDGLGLIGAADRANRGHAGTEGPTTTSSRPKLRDDVADAVRLWALVIGGIARALWRGCVDREVRAELFAALRPTPERPNADRRAPDSPTARPVTTAPHKTSAVVDVMTDDWDRYVTATGATSTAVVAALAADIVGGLRGPGPVDAAIPMAGTGQSLTMAEVEIEVGADPAVCAADLRAAYARAGSGRGLGPPGGMPAELLQLLGDRLAYAVVPDPGGREALVSPLGDLGPMFDELAGHRSSGLAVRSVYPQSGDTPSAAESATLLSVWSGRACGRITLSLIARHDIDERRLGELAVGALARRGVAATAW